MTLPCFADIKCNLDVGVWNVYLVGKHSTTLQVLLISAIKQNEDS